MKRIWSVVVLITLLGLAPVTLLADESKSLPGNPSVAVTQADMDKLVALCQGCHGPGGNSQRAEVPSLAGRDPDELFAEIERFYFYERRCPDVPVDGEDAGKGHMSMCDVTGQINKQEALALADYFSAQPVTD